MSQNRILYYVYDKKLVDISKNIPNVGNRAAVVQSLVASYNLHEKCKICPCQEATDEDLLSFHSADYVDCLKKAESASDLEKMTDSDEFLDFNLGYDCPLFPDMYKFARLIAGSSLTAARKLVGNHFQLTRKPQSNWNYGNFQPRSYLKYRNSSQVQKESVNFSFDDCDELESQTENVERMPNRIYEMEVKRLESDSLPISINWFGGWHHAQRDEAGGFCYVNDIVIAIQYLLKFYKRVLYVDLDVHHGNGVENAFVFSSKVLTLSLHKHESGFYPATGSLNDVGQGKGRFYTVNVPLKGGITDGKYMGIFRNVFLKIIKKYKPDCVVVQCGADCLTGDPLGGFNLTPNGVGECLRLILEQNLPTMVLGGGGYNVPNAARCWAYLTSIILGTQISNDIPENSFLHLYGPEFELSLAPGLRKDENGDEYLNSVLATVLGNLDNVSDV